MKAALFSMAPRDKPLCPGGGSGQGRERELCSCLCALQASLLAGRRSSLRWGVRPDDIECSFKFPTCGCDSLVYICPKNTLSIDSVVGRDTSNGSRQQSSRHQQYVKASIHDSQGEAAESRSGRALITLPEDRPRGGPSKHGADPWPSVGTELGQNFLSAMTAAYSVQ